MSNNQADNNQHHPSSLGIKCEPRDDGSVAETGKYDAFVNVMKDFKALRVDWVGVVERVNDLFKENPHLNEKFMSFFPKSDEITPDAKTAPLPGIVITYDNALGLTRSIMEHFHMANDVLESFMDVLGLFIKGQKSFIEVSKEVPTLFKGHPDLVHKFCAFAEMTKSIGTSGVVAVNGDASGAASEQKLADALTFVKAVKDMFQDDQKEKHTRYVPLQASVPGGVSGGPSGVASPAAAESRPEVTINDAVTYLKDVKDTLQDEMEKYLQFLDVMKAFVAQRVDTVGVIRRVKVLFKGHPNLIAGFRTFLPPGYEIILTDEETSPTKMTVEREEALSFVNKIKKRFKASVHVYQSFLDILSLFRKERVGIAEVYQEVATLFKDHPDLLDEFIKFLPDDSGPELAQTSFGRHALKRLKERSSAMNSMRQPHITKQRTKREKLMKLENKDKRNCGLDEKDPGNDNADASMEGVADEGKAARSPHDFCRNSDMDGCDDKDSLKSRIQQYEETSSAITSLLVSAAIHILEELPNSKI